MTEETGIKVTFSIKELLTEISRDIKDLSNKVDGKADKSVVDVVVQQMIDHNVRLNTLETQRNDKMRWQDIWLPFIVSLFVGAVLGATTLIAAFPHGVR